MSLTVNDLIHLILLSDRVLMLFALQIVGGAFAISRVGWRYAFYINRKSALTCTVSTLYMF